MDTQELRTRNLRAIVTKIGSQAALADLVGTNRLYISQLLSEKVARNVGQKLARRVEVACGLPDGWMDKEQSESEATVTKRLIPELIESEVKALTADSEMKAGMLPIFSDVGARSFAYRVLSGACKNVPEGSLAIVDPDEEVRDHDTVLVSTPTGVFVREYTRKLSGKVMLTGTATGEADEMPEDARIVGVVREVTLRIR